MIEATILDDLAAVGRCVREGYKDHNTFNEAYDRLSVWVKDQVSWLCRGDGMNVQQLANMRRLADYLETVVRDDQLNMDHWVGGEWCAGPVCGTTACAMGHAAAILPGVRIAQPYPEPKNPEVMAIEVFIDDACHTGWMDGYRYETIARFWGIDPMEAEDVFFNKGTRLEVVQKLRNLIKKYSANE